MITRKNHVLKCRVNKEEFEQIKHDAQVRGYPTLSAYIRNSISRGSLMEATLIDTNEKVRKILEVLK